MQDRNNILDIFKGIAIIAVILYHAGVFTYGYLGVDMFLVIGGYLITKSIMRAYQKGRFSYWDYICNRLVRLWPMAVGIVIISLAVGYFAMLPDAYKNTCETAVGSVTFTNNFVQYITAGNYWDTSNDFKPLMHTWYLGIIFQFYVIYPLIFIICHQCSKNYVRLNITVLSAIFVCSLLFYIFQSTNTALNFYMLPARLFEFALGGLIALKSLIGMKSYSGRKLLYLLLLLILILLFVNSSFNVNKVRLLMAVVLTSFIIVYSEHCEEDTNFNPSKLRILTVLAIFGVASYSLYLWHQVILAFYRNIVDDDFTFWSYLITITLSLVVGLLSYKGIEQPLAAYTKNNRRRKYLVLGVCGVMSLGIIVFSVKYYKTQGVVRDIPELEVCLNEPRTYAPQDYNARISQLYSKPFPSDNGKKNVLVVGDSYARDWINIILESEVDSINLIYSQDIESDLRQKIEKADIIFVANNGAIDKYVDYLPAMMKKRFYRVGHKIFDRGIGGIYNQTRMTGDYTHKEPALISEINTNERMEFDGMYINLMDSICDSDGRLSMFTPDKKLISHDGLHLTRAGAKMFADCINVQRIIKN